MQILEAFVRNWHDLIPYRDGLAGNGTKYVFDMFGTNCSIQLLIRI